MSTHRRPNPQPPRDAHAHGDGARLEAYRPEALHAQDHWHVNLQEAWEVAFWAREFGCSETELRRAVEDVGARAGDVRARIHQAQQQQQR